MPNYDCICLETKKTGHKCLPSPKGQERLLLPAGQTWRCGVTRSEVSECKCCAGSRSDVSVLLLHTQTVFNCRRGRHSVGREEAEGWTQTNHNNFAFALHSSSVSRPFLWGADHACYYVSSFMVIRDVLLCPPRWDSAQVPLVPWLHMVTLLLSCAYHSNGGEAHHVWAPCI